MMICSSPRHPAPTGLVVLVLCHCASLGALAGLGRELWRHPALGSGSVNESQLFLHATFPAGFLWGTGSSAFQTEGAWDEDGKGPSIWDTFTHSHTRYSGATANIASASYHHWEEDVAALKLLGVHHYAFSLSWPRLFPNGDALGPPNPAAVTHYNRLINQLRQEGIEPVVTLYHWDLPLALQEWHGGWLNDTLVDAFDHYAAFCFRTFGNRVRYWVTIHNPYLVAWQGYTTGLHAPGQMESPEATFTVAHNLIKAHAKAWHTYDRQFRMQQRGHVSIALGTHWIEPLRGQASEANVDRCRESLEAVLGWFAEPIHGTGDYPASLRENYLHFLPALSEVERQHIKGTADFFALSFGPNNLRLGHSLARFGQQVSLDLRRLLNWVKLEYDNPTIFIVENGWFSDATIGTEDTVAIYLMKKFINQVLQAVIRDGVRVIGYTAWSLVDGFEWNYGYSVRRGLFYVDFNNPSRTRVPKTTAYFYKQIISNHGFPDSDKSQEVQGQFHCHFHWGVSDSTLQAHLSPFSPQFTDTNLYSWNLTGDGALRPVLGVQLETRAAQCTDFLAIQKHVRLLEAAGVDHYRFALNWTLILPQGDLSVINTEALRYYRCVAQELQKRNVKVMVTLYYPTHHPPLLGLPVSIHKAGGWLNYSTVEAFRTYAALCFKELGPWVPFWVTINEPNRLSQAYNGSDPYLATHHLILAHTAAYRLYDKEFRHQQGALLSFSLHADWVEAANPFLESHHIAAERFLLFEHACFLDPFLGVQRAGHEEGGDYPKEVRDYLQERRRQGLSLRTLPHFTEQEKQEVYGALDFIAVNHFTTRLVSHHPSNSTIRRSPDHDCQLLSDPTWPSSPMGQSLVPWGLRRVLRWLKKRYGDHPLIITATGVDDHAARDDQIRQYCLKSYLQEVLKAYQKDGVNLKGFYFWKFQDRHQPKFGLFTSSHYQFSPKMSTALYHEIITHRGFPVKDRGRQCGQSEAQAECALCRKIFENRALLFFGICLFLTFAMLTMMAMITARRKRSRARRAPRATPKTHPRQTWDRVPLHDMIGHFRDNCL